MFLTKLVLEDAPTPDEWVVRVPLVWEDARFGGRIEVPAGFITDLASIPRVLRGVLDVTGPSRKPAVLHDWLYCSQPCSRAEADGIFRHALGVSGLGKLARNTYWAGVRTGGWLPWSKNSGGPFVHDFDNPADFYKSKGAL